eukprot:TRINITY_DN3275_c2_g1_i1.p1 TRINITY_DN3275_c2_g1~~TRINITY_DN3275_c2_g1_i1.p1  ORF type:complete len:324 (-),score=31.06 TRINITY_DN3275_c2_g1_i1:541-1512(-)
MDSQPMLVPQWLKEGNSNSNSNTKTILHNTSSHTSNTAKTSQSFEEQQLSPHKKLNGKQEFRQKQGVSHHNYKHILSHTRTTLDQQDHRTINGLGNGLVRSVSVNSSYSGSSESLKWGTNRTDFKKTLSTSWSEQKEAHKPDEGDLIEKTLRQRTKLLIPRVKQTTRVKGGNAAPTLQKQRQAGPIALKFVNAVNSQSEHGIGVFKKPDSGVHSNANSATFAISKKPKADKKEQEKTEPYTTKLSDRQNFFKILKQSSQSEQGETQGTEFTEQELQFLQALGWRKEDWENCDPLTDQEIAEFRASDYYQTYVSKRGEVTRGAV